MTVEEAQESMIKAQAKEIRALYHMYNALLADYTRLYRSVFGRENE